MKKTIRIIMLLVIASCTVENDDKNKIKIEIVDPVTSAQRTVLEESNRMVERVEKRAHDSRIVKFWVKRKSVKECMRLLKTNEINNEVVECNKDRYLSMRNDEVAAFKLKNEIYD